MENEKKSASVFQQTITFFIVMGPVLLIAALLWSHSSFQKRVVGVMKYSAAQELGLLAKSEQSPFTPQKVWFAGGKDGSYEFRSAWPVIGSVPFDFFGGGETDKNLPVECDRLGENACQRL